MKPPREVIGGYRLTRLLGAGGMGSVWLAAHPRTGAEVAVKLVLGQHAEKASVRQRFLREARAMAATKHPSLLEIFDVGEDEGCLYLVMEKLDGRDLDAALGTRKVRLDTLKLLADGLLAGLAALHEAGVVHRDLKPSNVMVARGPRVVVMDLGLARVEDAQTLTRTGAVIGTPRYLPPEAFDHAVTDEAGDVYQAGLVLWEAAAGRHVFDCDQPARLFQRIAEGDRPSLASVRPDLPAEVVGAIEAMLAVDPAARPGAEAARGALVEGRALPEPGAAAARGSERRASGAFTTTEAATRGLEEWVGGRGAAGRAARGAPRPAPEASAWRPRVATGLALGLAALAAASWWRPVALDPTGVEVVVGPGALAVRWAADGPAQGAVEVEDVASGAWRRVPVADVPVVSGRRQVLVEEVTPGARVRVSLEAAGLKLDLGEVRAGRAWAQASPTPVVEVEGRRWLDLQLGEGVRGASTRLLLAGPGADLEAPATLDLEDALGRQRAWSLRPAEVLREAARAFLDRCPRDHLEDLLALSKASAIDGLINDAANSIGIRTQGARTGLDRVRESLTPDGKNMAKTRAKMDAALQGRVWVRDYRRLRLALAEYLGRVRDDPAVHERVRARWGLVQRVARAYEMVAGGACLAVPTLERPAVEALPRLLGADLGRRTLRSPSARTFDVSYPASHFSRQVALPGDIPNGDLVVEVEMRFLTRQQALEVSLGGPPGVLLFPRGLGEGVTAESGTVRFRLPGAWRPAGPAVVHLSLRNVFDLRDPVPIEVDALRVYPAVGAAGPARLVGGDRGVFAAASEAR